MRIDVINLDQNPERLRLFRSFNSHIQDLHKFQAIEGSAALRSKLHESGILADAMPLYSDRRLGCAASHLALWEKAIEENRIVTVVEDDVVLNHNFDERAPALIESLPTDWDIILWGWNFDSFLFFEMFDFAPCLAKFDQDLLRSHLSDFRPLPIAPAAYRLLRAFGLLSYSVSPSGAAAIMKICLPIREMPVFFPGLNRWCENTGIDFAMNAAYPKVKAYVSVPPLAVSPNRSGSYNFPLPFSRETASDDILRSMNRKTH